MSVSTVKFPTRLRPEAPRPPGEPRRLRADEVVVWRASLVGPGPERVALMHRLLSSSEAERAAKFRFERDRRRFVMGRGILRTILGRYVGRPAGELALGSGPHGKPRLDIEGEPPVEFNVAHSDDLAVYAVTRTGPVGIDVERVRDVPEWAEIASACFTPTEQARIHPGAGPPRRQDFFRAWTRHEALLKGMGVGLGGARPPASGPDGGPEPWVIHDVHLENGYVGALATGPRTRWITWIEGEPDPDAPDFLTAREGQRTALEPTFAHRIDSL